MAMTISHTKQRLLCSSQIGIEHFVILTCYLTAAPVSTYSLPGRISSLGCRSHFHSTLTDNQPTSTIINHIACLPIFGRPLVKRFAICYWTVVCPIRLSCTPLSVCDIGVLWPNGWMDQDETWQEGRSRPRPHCVRSPSSTMRPAHTPTKKKAQPPIFGPRLSCAQTVGWIKIPRGMEVGLDPGDIVTDGDPTPRPKRDTASPTFWLMHCGPVARWIKMPLGTDVGLGPGRVVLDWESAPPKMGAQQPRNFRPMSVVAKRLHGSRWHLVWRWTSALATLCWMEIQLPPIGTQQPPSFRPMSIVAKRSPVSAAAEHLHKVIMHLNYVIVCCYRQHCAKRIAPVFNLLRGWLWGFSPRGGDTLHRWGWNLARRRGPRVQRLGYKTPKLKFYWDYINMWNINAPQGRTPWAISV